MNESYAISLKRMSIVMATISFMAVLFAMNFYSVFSNKVGAAQLSDRSLALSSTLPGTKTDGAAGSATNGSSATYTFEFDAATAGATNVKILFCDTAIGNCTTPTGMITTGATLVSATNGLALDSVVTNGEVTLNSGTIGAGSTVEIVLGTIKNPNETDQFYARIVTYSGGYVTEVDNGTVASAITEGIEITAKVKETLGFSTTGDWSAGVPAQGAACTPLTSDGAITLGDTDGALSTANAFDNYSAFRIYTNSANGTTIQYKGDTLTKGSDKIDAITGGEATYAIGTEQFGLGINKAAGGDDAVSVASGGGSTLDMTNVSDTGELSDASNGPLTIHADYDDAAGALESVAKFNYAVDTLTTLATTSSFTNCKTVAVRYMASVSPLTPAGTYTTTVVYYAVPRY